MSLIDVHTHVVPRQFPDRPRDSHESRWPCMHCLDQSRAQIVIDKTVFRELDARSWDADCRIADMDASNVAKQVLSPMPELLSYWFSASDGLEMCRWMNATIAEMVSGAPSRFDGFGIVPLQDPHLAAMELERLHREGFRGVEIGSNINEKLLGDPCFDDFYAAAESLNMAVFVHALHPIGRERLNQTPDLVPFAAFPLDTALTAISIIRAGVPVRFPRLKMGFSHGGGALAPLVHRLGKAWQMTNGFDGLLAEPPSAYAARFFYDNLVYDTGYLEYLGTHIAPNHVFCGTDYPYSIMEENPDGVIRQLPGALQPSMLTGAALDFLGY